MEPRYVSTALNNLPIIASILRGDPFPSTASFRDTGRGRRTGHAHLLTLIAPPPSAPFTRFLLPQVAFVLGTLGRAIDLAPNRQERGLAALACPQLISVFEEKPDDRGQDGTLLVRAQRPEAELWLFRIWLVDSRDEDTFRVNGPWFAGLAIRCQVNQFAFGSSRSHTARNPNLRLSSGVDSMVHRAPACRRATRAAPVGWCATHWVRAWLLASRRIAAAALVGVHLRLDSYLLAGDLGVIRNTSHFMTTYARLPPISFYPRHLSPHPLRGVMSPISGGKAYIPSAFDGRGLPSIRPHVASDPLGSSYLPYCLLHKDAVLSRTDRLHVPRIGCPLCARVFFYETYGYLGHAPN